MRKKPFLLLLLSVSLYCCLTPGITALPVGIGIGGSALFPLEGSGGSGDGLFMNGFSVFVDGTFRVTGIFLIYAGGGLDAARVDIPDRLSLLLMPVLYAGAACSWPVSPSISVCVGADAGIYRMMFEDYESAGGFRAGTRVSLEAEGVSGAVTLVPFTGISFYWDTTEWGLLFPVISVGGEVRFNMGS